MAQAQQFSQQLFDLLKRDHQQAEKTMQQIESASQEEREELFATLKQALTQHMQMEEKEFYPKLKKISEMQDLVQDALEEHAEAKEYLAELEDMEVDEEEWLSTFQDMQEGIQHHVEDEETEIFPECKRHLSEQQFQEIFQKCSQIKEQGGAVRGGKKQARKQPEAR